MIIFFGMIIILLALMEYCSLYYINNALSHIYVRRYFSYTRIVEGNNFNVIYEIINDNWFPVLNLKIIDMFPGTIKMKLDNSTYNFNNFHLNIRGHRKVTRTYNIAALKRDYISSRQLQIIASDMFHIRESQKFISSYDNIYIYPSLRKININFFYDVKDQMKQQNIYTESFSFYCIRDYQETDSIKNINWKKTAQLSKLMVNEYHESVNNNVIIFLNIFSIENNTNEAIENLLRTAAYLVNYLLEHRYNVGFCSNCTYKNDGRKNIMVTPDKGKRQLYKIFDLLSFADYYNLINIDEIIKKDKKTFYKSRLILLTFKNDMKSYNMNLFKNSRIDVKVVEV